MAENLAGSDAVGGGRDVLAELDSIKAYVESEHGKESPGDRLPVNQVTILSRFEELFGTFRQSLEHVVSGSGHHSRWKGFGADSEIVRHEDEAGE